MDLGEVMGTLDVAEHAEGFASDWERYLRAMPAGPLPFLTPEYVAWACREAFLPSEMAEAN